VPPSRQPPSRERVPRGFTLLELALVLAILVVIAALAWPALKRPLESERLRRSADRVRTICSAARNRAIVSGQTHVLRCQTGSGQYQVQVYTGGDAALESSVATSQTAATEGFAQVDLGHNAAKNSSGEIVAELPEGIVFQQSQAAIDLRAAAIDTTGDLSTESASGGSPVLFFADGTTSTAEITLADEQGRTVVIELRGLTGVTRAGPLQAAEERAR